MIQYYYNQKNQSLILFNPEKKEDGILILERLEGIQVFTGSELARPTNFTREDRARETDIPQGKKRATPKCHTCGGSTHGRFKCPKKLE
jgi:hypothetical protein